MNPRKLIRWMPLAILGLTLAGCDKASAPAATPGKPHSATLNWNASTSKVTGYRVYRATEPNTEPGLLAVLPADTTRYVDTTVDAGRTYYYTVKAFDSTGAESPPSARISAAIPAN